MAFFRYLAAAWVLKAFSVNALTRKAYRALGNRVAPKKHLLTSNEAIKRGLWMIDRFEAAGMHLNSRSTVLEIGTGWTHFYSIILHFFSNPKTYLFDIWDKRQLTALKEKYQNLPEKLSGMLPSRWQNRIPNIKALTQKISSVSSFDELYQLMQMSYFIEPDGKLDIFPSNTFDAVFSGDVMEHIHHDSLESVVQNFYRILKPGGLSIHQIGIDDHLTHYAPGMSPKNYVRYSNQTWERYFENQVQYFNRVQLPDYLAVFERNGFHLDYCSSKEDPHSVDHLTPAREFQQYDLKTLRTIRAYIVHRR